MYYYVMYYHYDNLVYHSTTWRRTRSTEIWVLWVSVVWRVTCRQLSSRLKVVGVTSLQRLTASALMDHYFSQTLRRLRRLRRLVTRQRSDWCWWCLVAQGEARTEVVRRHSDMGLLRTKSDRYRDSRHNVSPNDIARLIWLNRMRMQTRERGR